MSLPPVIARAHALDAAGRGREAVAHLDTAARAGDPQALVEFAIWHLAGRHVSRDLTRGRALMATAARAGHAAARLMHASLVANGTGGPADWAAAMALLRVAAAQDAIAAEQLSLVDAMLLSGDGVPPESPKPERLAERPRVLRYRAFLNEAECAHIAMTAAELLEPATVIDPSTGRQTAHPIRTSDGGAIGPLRETLPVRAINRRLAAASGTDIAQGEPLTVLRYRPGQQYREHLDTIAGAANQRVRTVLCYLNAGYRGGETVFPRLRVTIAPQPGDVVVFDNLLPDGAPDPDARHAGLPVTAGAKWLATRWVRQRPIDPWTMS
jgi:prolyl 4-hydroxylase